MNSLAVVEVLTGALRAAGADLSARTDGGATPLHLAAQNFRDPEVVAAILATGSSPMTRDERGRTPLHYAAMWGSLPIIDRLVAAGANLNARDEVGFTPLHFKVTRLKAGDRAELEALISAGAELNTLDKDGNSPLHSAVVAWVENSTSSEVEESSAIELLLDGGADAHARNAAGETPWDIVQASDDLDTLKKQDVYWKLNDARFKTPVEAASAAPTESAHSPTVPEGGSECHIPGYPRPANPQGLSLPWCPASVDFQIRVFALQAAGAQCAIATGSSSTADQIQMRRREIEDLCKRLDALDGTGNCRCPAELRP